VSTGLSPGAAAGLPGSAGPLGLVAGVGAFPVCAGSGFGTGNRTRCELPGATSPGFRMVGGALEPASPLPGLPSPMAISWVSSGSR